MNFLLILILSWSLGLFLVLAFNAWWFSPASINVRRKLFPAVSRKSKGKRHD